MRIEIDISGNITEHEDAPIILPTEAQILSEKVNEALSYLVKTNHKCFIGYIPKDGEDLVAIQALRDEALLFIRANNVPNP